MNERESTGTRESAPGRDDDAGERASSAPARERRSSDRVADNQGSGHGAMTALSRLKMQERQRRLVRRPRDADDGEGIHSAR